MFNEIRVLLLPIVVIALLVFRRSRRQKSRAKHGLEKRQRAVYIQQQWLDPVIELVIVGGVLWLDLRYGLWPWLAVIVGIIIGLPLGAWRGKFMYVRSLDNSHKVVVERNPAEIAILAVLILIKFAAHAISANPNSPLNLIAVALLGTGIASSVGRVAYITYRHFSSRRQPAKQ